MADAPKINATQTPCVTGFQIGGCARLPLRECVPAGCPEPYLYDRLNRLAQTSRWGWAGRLKTAAANQLQKFQNIIVTHFVCEVNQ